MKRSRDHMVKALAAQLMSCFLALTSGYGGYIGVGAIISASAAELAAPPPKPMLRGCQLRKGAAGAPFQTRGVPDPRNPCEETPTVKVEQLPSRSGLSSILRYSYRGLVPVVSPLAGPGGHPKMPSGPQWGPKRLPPKGYLLSDPYQPPYEPSLNRQDLVDQVYWSTHDTSGNIMPWLGPSVIGPYFDDVNAGDGD